MLYESYRQKVLKRAALFNKLKRFRWLFMLLAVFIAALTASLLSVSGLVYDITDCPQTVIYGEELGYRAGAVFNKTALEFAKEGSDEWSGDLRLYAGEYKVRAVSESVAGAPRYGKVRKFTVLPKNIEVYADDGGFTYGDEPSFTGDTAYGDKIVCAEYDCDYLSVAAVRVTPLGGITAVDENGNGVDGCYSFSPVARTVALNKRKITVVVADKTAVYDGTAVSSDEYSLDPSTTLAEGDRIVAKFTLSAVNAGRHPNIPQITLYHGATDVTEYYDADIKEGAIIIEKKTLRVTSGDAEKTYDGDPLSCDEYSINDGYSAVKGHKLAVKSARSVTNAGEYENLLNFTVSDESGGDVTGNYNIICGGGTLKVNPRPVTVKPETSHKIYDGTLLAEVTAITSENSALSLLSGHSAGATVVLSQADVGESTAEISSVTVKDGSGKPVTSNYVFTYENGAVITDPRPVTLQPVTFNKIYDGTAEVSERIAADVNSSSEYPLVAGHKAKVSVVTALINVGSANDKIVSVRITDAGGKEVTGNYSLSYADGIINVKPRPVTVTASDGEWIYDGDAHSESKNTPDGLVLNHSIKVLTCSSITEVGTADNVLTVDIVDGETSVIKNYAVTYKKGVLKVKPRPVTVFAGSAKKIYDGYELYNFSYGISEDTPLVDGHTYYAWVYGSQLDVGESPNKIEEGSVHIYADNGNSEVTRNYAISYEDGVLKVIPRPVSLKPADAAKQYDGTPLTSSAVESCGGYELVEGHTVTAQTIGSQTEIGRSENSVVEGTVKIFDANRRDVTANYTIENYVVGFLDVQYEWTFAYSTESAEKYYDGKPITCDEYTVTQDVPDGFTYEITVIGSVVEGRGYDYSRQEYYILATGQAENAASVIIRNADGEDVTHLVHIEAEHGTLTVLPRPITVETNSRVWEYDGRAHSDDGFKISDNSAYKLIENHTAGSENPSEIVNVGVMFNSMDIIIRDKSGYNVSYNYEIFTEYGTLEVTGDYTGVDPDDPDNPGGSGSGSGGSLDQSGDIGLGPGGGSGGNADGSVPVRIYSDTGGEVYLRLMSFGDYNGKSWSKFADYPGRVDGVYGMAYLTGNALSWYGFAKSHMILSVSSNDYLLPYYISPDSDANAYRVQSGDVYFQGDTRKNYSVDYYNYDYLTDYSVYVNAQFRSAEERYRSFVYSKYLNVPQSTRAYMQSIISERGWTADAYGIVGEVARYVQGAAAYSLDYNRNLDKQPDIAVAFLRDYKEGICQHYATAATLLFRTLGIPARYTVGYAGVARANEWVDIKGEQAHAWVEVYIDGAGWIKVEVTGGGPGGGTGGAGSGSVLPDRLVIKPADAAKSYDGTPLQPTAVEMTYDLKRLLFAGYTYTCEFGGFRTEVGESSGVAYNFELYDPVGRKVSGVNYEYYPCIITVTPASRPVAVIHPYGITKIYDGFTQYCGVNDYYVTGLPEGYSVSADLSVLYLENAGILTKNDFASVRVRVYDGSGRDVTDSCFILWDTADMLGILKRKIILTAASAQKVYDGEPLTEGGYYISYGAVASYQNIEVTVSGSITDAGTAKNKITSVKIYDYRGNDVTDNYEIVTVDGTLSVIDG